VKADYQVMLRHLQLLFGACRDAGLVELAFGCPAPNKAMLTDTRGLEQLAGEALLQNGRGYNIYIGANLRHAHTAPFARAKDRDVICAPAVVVDLDKQGRAENAPNLWGDMPPSFCVVTGMHPHKRMQMWWLLDEPMLALDIWSSLQRAMAAKYDGDTTVTNPSRVMRLAGSLAQPVKPGRVLEPTFLERISEPLKRFSVAQITEHCEAFLGASPTYGPPQAPVCATVEKNSLGLGPGKLTDGREQYMRDTVLACLRDFIGTHGCVPTTDELYELVWPQYEEHVAIEVPGKITRGERDVFAKCLSTLNRFCRGEISSMRDLDAALVSHSLRTDTYQVEAPPLQPQQPQQPQHERFPAFELRDRRAIPRREWLYAKHYIRGFVSCTVAPGGVGKSALTMVEAVAMVTGKPLLGHTPTQQCRVMLWNGEDPYDELERRLASICLHYNVTPEELTGRLYVDSGRNLEIILGSSQRTGALLNDVEFQALAADLTAKHIDVLIIDPLVSTHRLNENSTEMDPMFKAIARRLAEACSCSVELVHHSRKANGEDVTADHARGSSTLQGAVRDLRLLNRMTVAEAAQLGLDEHPGLFFRVDIGKANMAAPADKAEWYRHRSVDLGNTELLIGGDNVGVVERWIKPDPLAGVTGQDVERALWELRAGTGRVNPRSPEWAGKLVARVLGLDLNDNSGKARVRMMLQRWENSGALRRVSRVPVNGRDRHPREFYEVVDTGEADGD